MRRAVKNSYQSHAVEMVFETFVHFYENNFKNMEHWFLDEENFPNGTNDLMWMYKWLKSIRPKNYDEFGSLCFNSDKEYFEYWGARYKGFTFKINGDGALKLIPQEAVNAIKVESVFEKNLLKLQNALYALDTEKCNWIIDRRKFLQL